MFKNLRKLKKENEELKRRLNQLCSPEKTFKLEERIKVKKITITKDFFNEAPSTFHSEEIIEHAIMLDLLEKINPYVKFEMVEDIDNPYIKKMIGTIYIGVVEGWVK